MMYESFTYCDVNLVGNKGALRWFLPFLRYWLGGSGMIPAFIFCKNFEKILISHRDTSIFVFFKKKFKKKYFFKRPILTIFDHIFGIFSKFYFFNEKIFLTPFSEFFSEIPKLSISAPLFPTGFKCFNHLESKIKVDYKKLS